jgi:predicted enzyme related to lactoylglutathione lyase
MTINPSRVIWYELMTTDPEGAARFYTKAMGWRFGGPTGGPIDYRMIEAAAGPVAGLLTLPPGARESGLDPGWFLYLDVPDVDAETAAIAAVGGTVLMPASDVPGVGRFSLIADPWGACLYLMTPTGEGPSISHNSRIEGHGAWHELHTKDGAKSFDFYTGRFGWEADGSVDMGPQMGLYRLFKIGDVQSGGIMTDPGAARPYWAVYFLVGDIDAAAARITKAGGRVLFGPQAVPGDGYVVTAQDPEGAMFHITGPRL